MKYLIIGGGGFIGHNVIREVYTSENATCFVVDHKKPSKVLGELDIDYYAFDANDTRQLALTIKEIEPDCIFHLAANSDIGKSSTNPQIDLTDTFGTTNSLIHALVRADHIADVVFSSTSAVYGFKYEKITEDAVKNPISAYGWMKYASEELLISAQKEGIVNRLLIARFPNVTGEFQTHGVVFDLVKKLHQDNEKLKVLGNGNQTKPYMTARLLSKVLLKLIHLEWKDKLIVNIGPSDAITVKKIVSILKEISCVDFEARYDSKEAGWPGDVPNYLLDTRLLHTFMPELNIPGSEEAVTESIAYQWNNAL